MTETPADAGAVHRAASSTPLAAWLHAPTGGRRMARGLGYLLAGLPVGIVAFVVAVTGLTTGASTLMVWVGLPILVGTLLAARGLATVERRAVHWATDREPPPHHYCSVRGRPVARMLGTLADPQSWRDLLHCLVAFPLRITTFAIAVSWAGGGLGATLWVLWGWSLPRSDSGYHGLFEPITGSSWWLGEIARTARR